MIYSPPSKKRIFAHYVPEFPTSYFSVEKDRLIDHIRILSIGLELACNGG